MALIVEDGTGLSNAESYVSVSECDDYAYNHGLSWTAVDSDKEVALRKATQYLDSVYRWKSCQSSQYTQALKWPRVDYQWDWPQVARLKAACCELAIKSMTTDLFADVNPQHVTSVQVGPIHKTMSAPANGGQKRFAAIDALLADLIRGSGGVEVVRS